MFCPEGNGHSLLFERESTGICGRSSPFELRREIVVMYRQAASGILFVCECHFACTEELGGLIQKEGGVDVRGVQSRPKPPLVINTLETNVDGQDDSQ